MKHKKQNNISLLILFATTLWSPFSQAVSNGGLFIEPAITYESGTIDINYPAPFSDSKEDVKGYGLGLRAGLHFHEILFVAVDGRYSQPNYNSSALGESTNSTASNLGLSIGAQTPLFGLRVWGTYVMDGILNPDKVNLVDLEYTGMNGCRVGAGLYVAIVSVNLEYQETKYSGITIESLGPFADGSLNNLEAVQKSFILSVSLPLAL
jgi:hypothetical protein